MHATSLQGFGYDDVVHQFENRYNYVVTHQFEISSGLTQGHYIL
ncbi:MAG: hypothetical protein O4805_07275 [Trichodesmium sp. St16_bin2-tuft]|nr:hypothetical protein [Trichodesmium sp. St16_bin2-tuft]MDE5119637.1 hypothetical protein [Trichodesmium sp. St19_bin1]